MSSVNNVQVQSTNDASSTSKCSAATKNYFRDNFIEEFVEKKKPRAALINLGYYTRALIVFQLIENYITFLKSHNISKFQIVSCGAGFDTTYWRLSEIKLLTDTSIFIEVDFPSVVEKKISMINQSTKLKSLISHQISNRISHAVHVLNCNYYLIKADLGDINNLESLFVSIKADFDVPTLFLSECVITYMNVKSSDYLIQWMAKKFKNCAFINYEQIHPYDGFGKVMLRHFEKLQSTLHSVTHYPDCESHCIRYNNLGFKGTCVTSEWNGFLSLTTSDERLAAFSLELFDEFEEFHNKCVHYVIGLAGNEIALKWINSLQLTTLPSYKCPRNVCKLEKIYSLKLEVYRHCSFTINEKLVYLLGGCFKQKRNSTIHKICFDVSVSMEVVNVTGREHVQLDTVYASTTHFKLNQSHYCCLYGGRTSPDSICNSGSFIIFQILNNKWILKCIVNEENTTLRFRNAMVSTKEGDNKANIWIFGGRSSTLGELLPELLLLQITLTEKEVFTYKWTTYKKKNENWPAARMSHSMVVCPKTSSLLISCGLQSDTFDVLNDVWKWDYRAETWNKLEFCNKILPRYGHTSHLIDNKLYLIGGVNTLAGLQPGLAIVSLDTLTVTEYSIEVLDPEPVLLFNHTSEIVDAKGKLRLLILGGGGNCFSFGTHLNQGVYCLPLDAEDQKESS